MKYTTLYDYHKKLNAKMAEYAGFMMPIEYAGIVTEHNAVRNHCGIFDVSHMGEIMLAGPDALKFVNHLITNTVTEKNVNRVVYGMLTKEDGGIIDDLFVYKFSNEEILLVVNAANVEIDMMWIKNCKKGFNVKVKNLSGDYGEVTIQGPDSATIFTKFFQMDVTDFKFMTYRRFEFNGKQYLVSRSGYTGEDGFEIYSTPDVVHQVFIDLVEQYQVEPCGLGCRDTLRFEAALPLYGHEMSMDINPLETGMSFAVKLDKEEFNGKDALIRIKEMGVKRQLVGIELIEKNIPRSNYEVIKDGRVIGSITTGYLSITLNKPIALALIDTKEAYIGNEVGIQIRKKLVPARIIDKQFYTKNYKK